MNQRLIGDNKILIDQLVDSGQLIDHVFSSPPYFQLFDYGVDGQHGLEGSFTDYLGKVSSTFINIEPLLGEGSSVFVNIGETFNNYSMINTVEGRRKGDQRTRRKLIKTHDDGVFWQEDIDVELWEKEPLMVASRLASYISHHSNLKLRFIFVWDKITGGGPGGKSDSGVQRHEYVLHLVKWTKGSRMYAKCLPFGDSVVRIRALKNSSNPCSFPPDLPCWFLKNTLSVHDNLSKPVILDPYGGANNTGDACDELGMNYIGMDLKRWV